MAQHYTITGNLRALIGSIDFTRVQASVVSTLPSGAIVIDETSKTLELGIGLVDVSADGLISTSLLQTNATDTNVSGWQYYLEVSAPQHGLDVRSRRQERVVHRLGPFSVTKSDDLADHVAEFDTPAVSPTWRAEFRDEMDGRLSAAADQAQLAAMFAGAQSGVRNAGALASWRAALAAPGAAKAVLIGDSITDGGLASTYGNTIAQELQTRLRSLTGTTGGIGYVSATPSTAGAIVPDVPNTRAGTAVMWSHGLGGRAMYLGQATHHVTYATQPCTKVKVYYGKTSVAGGGLKVLIDGVDQGVTLLCAAVTNSGGHVWESPALTPGNHVVKLVPFNPPFVGIVEGVEFINGDETTGVRVYNAAHSGGSVVAYNDAAMDLHWQAVAAVDPDLVTIMLGTNDIASSTAPAFLAGIDTMLGKINPSTPVLLIGCYLRGDYTDAAGKAKWQQMQAGLLARATGRVAHLDLAPHWPDLVADGSTSAGLMFDTPPIHPNDAGMDLITKVIAAAVGHSSDLSFTLTATGVPVAPSGILTATNAQAAFEQIAGFAFDGGAGGGVPALFTRTDTNAFDGPQWRTNFTGTLVNTMSNIMEHWQGSRLVAYANEWGASRFRPGYTGYADAGTRFIVETGDYTGTAGGGGAAVEIIDRRVPDGPARKRWRRMWEDGSLQRNGIPMADTYVRIGTAAIPAGLPVGTVVVTRSGP